MKGGGLKARFIALPNVRLDRAFSPLGWVGTVTWAAGPGWYGDGPLALGKPHGKELDTHQGKLAASRVLNENSSLFGQARVQIELDLHAAVEAVARLAETPLPYKTGVRKKPRTKH